MSALSIVDSHVHLWDPARLRYAWLAGLPELNRSFGPADFSGAAAGCNAGKMIFVEAGCDAGQGMAEVEWASKLAKSEPRLRGIVAHAAVEKGAAVRTDLERLAGHPLVRGVRRLLQGEPDADFCLRPDFVAGVKLLAGFNFTFDLCVRHDQLPAIIRLAGRVPEVMFVLDHCGKPAVRSGLKEPWARNIKELAARPNVVCKISGLVTEADHAHWIPDDLKFYLQTVAEHFGPDRLLFGSDWPVMTLAGDYEEWVGTVREFFAAGGT